MYILHLLMMVGACRLRNLADGEHKQQEVLVFHGGVFSLNHVDYCSFNNYIIVGCPNF